MKNRQKKVFDLIGLFQDTRMELNCALPTKALTIRQFHLLKTSKFEGNNTVELAFQ